MTTVIAELAFSATLMKSITDYLNNERSIRCSKLLTSAVRYDAFLVCVFYSL
jgi:hypothetical protein